MLTCMSSRIENRTQIRVFWSGAQATARQWSAGDCKCGAIHEFAELRAGGSYISQNDPRLHFGLGAEAKMDQAEIRWPSGKIEVLKDLPADYIYTIIEGRGVQQRASIPNATGK